MPGPLTAAGAVPEQSAYAALVMETMMTGLVTNRSFLRDPGSSYLMRKFYQGMRFDAILDGLNREISVRMTDVRRPGTSVWTSGPFSQAASYYSFKYIQNQQEVVQVISDDATGGQINDVTPGAVASYLFTKSIGAGKTRFLGVGTSLYFGDGKDQKKMLAAGTAWAAITAFSAGALIVINQYPSSHTMWMALGGLTLNVTATSCDGTFVYVYFNQSNIPEQFPNLVGAQVTFSGLTGAAFLNGIARTVASVVSTSLGILAFAISHAAYSYAADTGSGSTGNGTSGASQPSFGLTEFAVVQDAGQQWKCYGPAVQNWGLQAPAAALTVTPKTGVRYWQPTQVLIGPVYYSILDSNSNVQILIGNTSPFLTGRQPPVWNSTVGGFTQDANILWLCCGQIRAWVASATVYYWAIVDPNGNLQVANGGFVTGATQPASWNATMGGSTADGTGSWINCGPGTVLSFKPVQYSFSTHAIDGSVSTAAPAFFIQSGILGPAQTAGNAPTSYLTFTASYVNDSQIDQCWLWRTAQGQATLILEDQFAVDAAPGTFNGTEFGIPDTSGNGSAELDAFIAAPVADANNPPPAGLTALAYHAGRVWGKVGNLFYYSGGPDTVVGNGNTAWPPLNFMQIPEAVTAPKSIAVAYSGQLTQGLLVFGTTNLYIVLGAGTVSSPFLEPQIWQAGLGVASYDEIFIDGATIYAYTTKRKLLSLDPNRNLTDLGLPIADQFLQVSTGGLSGNFFIPGSCYLTLFDANDTDSALYLSDGQGHWFRLSALPAPESGFAWSPIAAIAGATGAIQSIETTPGNFNLLISPTGNEGAPIYKRDPSTNQDNYLGPGPYPAWDVRGNIVLCSSGEVAEVAHIALKSKAAGSRPAVSLLFDELTATTATPFDRQSITSTDPPNQKPSQTMYSDRYSALQNGTTPLCDNLQLKIDYGTQNAPDELLMFAVYGSHHPERKAQ